MKGLKNYEEIFAQSIGLNDVGKVSRTELNAERREIHIYVAVHKTGNYKCPECGISCARYDDEEKDRIWLHSDVAGFLWYVHCRRPRIRCESHGVRVITVPWARKHSRYTLSFECHATLLTKFMPVNCVRKILQISRTSLSGIIKHWAF